MKPKTAKEWLKQAREKGISPLVLPREFIKKAPAVEMEIDWNAIDVAVWAQKNAEEEEEARIAKRDKGMNKKYEFTGKTMDHYGRTLRRIRRLADGELGGWIECEHNLCNDPQSGAWVGGEAKVYDTAQVREQAQVREYAEVCDETIVRGQADVFGQAHVWGQAQVHEQAQVCGRARVHGEAKVYGQAQVREHANVCDEAIVRGQAHVWRHAQVGGQAQVYEQAQVFGCAQVFGQSAVFGQAHVSGRMMLYGEMRASHTPLYALLMRHAITVADNIATIGCEAHPFDHWRKHIEEIGRKHDYSEEDIALYRRLLFAMMDEKEAELQKGQAG